MKLEKFKQKDPKKIGIIVFTVTCVLLVAGVDRRCVTLKPIEFDLVKLYFFNNLFYHSLMKGEFMNKPYKYKDSFYFFDHDLFNDMFSRKCNQDRLMIKDMEEHLANAINVSKNTVHGWRCKTYSPNDLNLVNDIANYFGYEKDILLCKKGRDVKMKKMTDIELMSVKRVYESIIEFLEYFYKTNGFNDLWFDFEKFEPSLREEKLWKIAEKEHDKVMLSLKKEYPIIGKIQIYTDLSNFIYNDLYDIYDGKLTYAYRFESIPAGNPTTDEDYTKAYKKLNEIIDSYC